MRTLNVYLNDRLVGELAQEASTLCFTYAESYRSLSGSLPLSRHLPLAGGVFDDGATRAFFANLLPEGEVRVQVARQLGISAGNVFALLAAIGGDCAGAVSLVSMGEVPATSGRYRGISVDELAQELANLPAHPFLAGEEGVRLSLAGAQNKLPVYIQGGKFFIPEGDRASSHILKIAIPHLEGTVINEAFCMNLAHKVGLPVPVAQVIQVGGQQVFMIERYDRLRSTGEIKRLHQEDFCQALGVLPEMKYEQEGGPGFAACFNLVEEWSDEPALDTVNLLRWALFNFLIGNADSHAKNLSFLYYAGTIRLAPFYDLLSTAVYARLNNRLAMKIGGQKDPRYLAPNNIVEFATEAGIGVRIVKGELADLCTKLEEVIVSLAESYREAYHAPLVIDQIVDVVEKRVRKARGLIS